MKTKTQQRTEWIIENKSAIENARTDDHRYCRGKCRNGALCRNQSNGGWGWWANALDGAGVDPERSRYWSGFAPTPSTSINKGIAEYIDKNAPEKIR